MSVFEGLFAVFVAAWIPVFVEYGEQSVKSEWLVNPLVLVVFAKSCVERLVEAQVRTRCRWFFDLADIGEVKLFGTGLI